MSKLLHKDEVYAIVGAAMEVYNTLGAGFLEPVYKEALEIELKDRGIPFEAQKELRISYKERQLEKTDAPDFVVFGKVIVEINSLNCLTPRFCAVAKLPKDNWAGRWNGRVLPLVARHPCQLNAVVPPLSPLRGT